MDMPETTKRLGFAIGIMALVFMILGIYLLVCPHLEINNFTIRYSGGIFFIAIFIMLRSIAKDMLKDDNKQINRRSKNE